MDGGAAARPRRDHRRPADAAARRAAAAARSSSGSACRRSRCSATTTSRSAATRRRGASNLRELVAGDAAARRGRRCSSCAAGTVWIAGDASADDRRAAARRSTRTRSRRDADLRILLCHFPRVLDRLEPGSFDLVLAGHMHDGQICVPYPGGKIRLAHPTARYVRGVYRTAGRRRCTSRPGSGRRSCRSASPPARRRRSSCCARRYASRRSGGPGLDLDRHPRPLRGRCGARGRRRARAVGELDPGTARRRPRQQRGRRRPRRAAPRRRLGRVRSRQSGARCRSACASTCCSMADVEPAVGRRRRRGDRAAAVTTRIAGLTYATLPTAPTVCHECIWWQSREGRSVEKRRWITRRRGGVGRLGDGLLRRRRAGCSDRCSTGRRSCFRAPPSCRPGRRATTRCSSRARTSPTRRSRG